MALEKSFPAQSGFSLKSEMDLGFSRENSALIGLGSKMGVSVEKSGTILGRASLEQKPTLVQFDQIGGLVFMEDIHENPKEAP